MHGYGQQVLVGNERFKGPGGQSVTRDGDRYYLVYHAYDAQNGGHADVAGFSHRMDAGRLAFGHSLKKDSPNAYMGNRGLFRPRFERSGVACR